MQVNSSLPKHLVLAAAIAVISHPVVAQESKRSATIEEVMVTAQKREESLQDAPISIAAFGADALVSLGIDDFSGLAVNSPDITFTEYPQSNSTIIMYMRGMGNADAEQITRDNAIGMYVDGVYIARSAGMTFDLADIERIEVLRGPQSTLYGRNTTGGAVNIVSQKPSGEFGFKENLSIGNDGYFRSLSVLDLPAVANISAKISYVTSEKDGWVDNVGESPDFHEKESEGYRVALTASPTESITVDYIFDHSEIGGTPFYYHNERVEELGFIPGYVANGEPTKSWMPSTYLQEEDTEVDGHALTLTWDINANMTLKSITAYREVDASAWQDYMLAFSVLNQSNPNTENEQFSQELQLIGTALDDQLQYVGGIFYMNEESEYRSINNNMDPQTAAFGCSQLTPCPITKVTDVDAESTSKAIFAQGTYTLTSQLDITLGLRYTKDDREASRSQALTYTAVPLTLQLEDNISNAQDYSNTDWNLTFNYAINDDLSVYAKAATGYKAGGSNMRSGDFTQTFTDETLITYEAGVKSFLADRRIQLNAAAFYTDFEDVQFDYNSAATDLSVVDTLNGDSAYIQGFEMNLLAIPTEGLSLGVDYTYLNAVVDKAVVPEGQIFVEQVVGGFGAVINHTPGEDVTEFLEMPYSPQHAYHVFIDYAFPEMAIGSLSARMDYNWQDEADLSAVTYGYGTRDDYGLLSARVALDVSLPGQHELTVALWGKNLDNESYQSHRIHLASIQGTVDSYGEPRSYGIDFNYKF